MWQSLRISRRALSRLDKFKNLRRTFLSESYRCTEAWNKRLESPLLSKINPSDIYLEVEKKFQKDGKASAVDVDIFANTVTRSDHEDELLDVLHKLRLTPEATNILDSTHHAVIRYLFDNECIDDLLTVLHDRMNYGIFPDHLTYNVLMDAFLRRGDYASAAKVAVLPMLQEDSEHPICNALALYSCHKYLENPEVWKAPEPEPPEDPNGEEIKVRVRFIRNPYFDDHFDLTDPEDLVGKTLVFYGKTTDDPAGRSWLARGLVLWKKYGDAAKLLETWSRQPRPELIYAETLHAIEKRLDAIATEDTSDDAKKLRELVNNFDKKNLKEGSLLEDIEGRVRAAVEARADADVAEIRQTYEDWEKNRVSLLEAQLAEYDRQERLKRVDEMKKELETRERFLTFFDNRHKIELQIEQKLKHEKDLYGKRKVKISEADKNYVPPEVNSARRKNE